MADEKETVAETTEATKAKKKAKPVVNKPMVHIDLFIAAITPIYGLSRLQTAGFKAYMTGRHDQKETNDFLPYLELYQGKKKSSPRKSDRNIWQ